MTVHQSVLSKVHCINPHCLSPIQAWGNNFCQSCGTPLLLNDRYIPLRKLSAGGFAKIYIIWDQETQTERILKVLLESSPKALELFDQEAWVLASMRHSGIPRVETGDYFHLRKRNSQPQVGHSSQWFLPCLVMEKIDGCTLEEILEQYPQGCPDFYVINWLSQAVEILWELHRRKIIHRDIKPSNLMLREIQPSTLTKSSLSYSFHHQRKKRGQLVIIDFGGVKQISNYRIQPRETVAKRSTTRLVSPGYSPPEQINGDEIGPFTDFYALGRTCIHLLTGQYPAELEDPLTGKLKWRQLKPVHPALANLLDDMVSLDVAQRPATAAEVQVRLAKIYRRQKRSLRIYSLATFATTVKNLLIAQLKNLSENINRLFFTLSKIFHQIVSGCVDTIWEMVLGAIGGSIGATFGLIFAYWSGIGDRLASIFTNLIFLVWDVPLNIGPEILVFGLAGLGTGVGLTDVGGLGQRRRYGLAAFMGIIGYILGGLCWQFSQVGSSVYTTKEDLIILEIMGKLSVGVATGVITLGLGLRKHNYIYALIVATLTAIVFVGLEQFNIFPELFLQFSAINHSQPNLLEFFASITFFSLLGCIGGFCLGVSHYVIIPILRWLGLR
ncbi:MAG: serine/threonine protein kinase [Okeania sp. SIO2C9]|uniref:serine/threonine-protein kinase n=1 Tax=Okeania sp. SIO2C9 TaxID=2607791 RepID=UPI0013C19093|nr:serine/threonine-protein kinase [Okeania sp. SIO2C9]NEQ72797.1 serine/threonine protein kinase [Okeania sp. SIO2C9]